MDEILLLGAGPMAVDYAKVLKNLGVTPTTIGRGKSSAASFKEQTGISVETGGAESWIESHESLANTSAIVAVGEKHLGTVTLALLKKGCKKILVEKPGGGTFTEIFEIADFARETSAQVYVGYNRRYYASLLEAEKLISDDGGVTSFSFEFTEWGHVIQDIPKEEGVKENWFLHNSTHVVDMAFHLGGHPKSISCFTAGKLDWHPDAAVFAGAGKSENGALFSYQANWAAPGRFALEVLTRKNRYIFRPLEKLQVQKLGSVAVDFVDIDDDLDQRFKPGLFLQVQDFLKVVPSEKLPRIADQVRICSTFLQILGKR